MESGRILRRREVEHLTGLSRSAIYAAIQRGEFPKQVRLGRRSVGWMSNAVEEWVRARSSLP